MIEMKLQTTRMMAIACVVGLLASLAIARPGQDPQETHVKMQMAEHALWVAQGGEPVGFAFGDSTFEFVTAEMSLDGKVVKGAPFSAQTVNEHVQVLGDGNRIVHRNSGAFYRDTEGRTRREQQIGTVGPLTNDMKKPVPGVVIRDPIAGTTYIVDTTNRTARRIGITRIEVAAKEFGAVKERLDVVRAEGAGGAVAVAGKTGDAVITTDDGQTRIAVGGPGLRKRMGPGGEPKTESLGKQTMEGVEVEGTRTTRTIAAGEIGNEQPINIVTERWYSPELNLTVYHKFSDPRFGETTHKLLNVQRGEPNASLFQVPSDYTIEESKMRRPSPAPRIRREREQ
jgi:hypothetical protein